MNELPDKPQTATFVKMFSPDKPNVFAFAVSFPSGTKRVICTLMQPNQVLALDLAEKYSEELVDDLIKSGEWDSVNFTNWASATAAIQAIIIQFNEQVREEQRKGFVAPMATGLQ